MGRILYHYCSSETFFEIISKSRLWFGNVLYMNDIMEGRWLEKVIVDSCDYYTSLWENNETTMAIKSFIKTDMMKVIRGLESENKRKTRYILCLSEEPDLLSQWRGYGDDGHGVSVGIDIDRLISSKCYYKLKNDTNKYVASINYPEYLYNEEKSGKVIYLNDKEENNFYIKNIFNRIKEMIDKGVEIEKIKINLLLDIMNNIIYKNPYFSEEKEWRIECSGEWEVESERHPFRYSEVFGEFPSEIKIEGPIFNMKNNVIKEHFEVDFSLIKEKIIKEIYLGPKCKLNENEDVREKILKASGYSNSEEIRIVRSQGTYR